MDFISSCLLTLHPLTIFVLYIIYFCVQLAHAFAHAFADLPDSSGTEAVAPSARGNKTAPNSTATMTTTQVAEGEDAAALLQELLAPPPQPLNSAPKAQAAQTAAAASLPGAAAAGSGAQFAGSSDGLEALMSQLMTATKAEATSAPSGAANAGNGAGKSTTAGSESSVQSSGEDEMDSLLVSLMSALGTDSGKAEFKSLAAAEAPLSEPPVNQHKEASAPSFPGDGSGSTAASIDLDTGKAQAQSEVQSAAVPGGASGEDLESLMGSLMLALGTASGQAEFKALVTDKDENVLGRPLN
jgi:hypothetical protein